MSEIWVTETQYKILIGLSQNQTIKEIAAGLGVEVSTVREHLKRLHRETGLTTYRAVALAFALFRKVPNFGDRLPL